MIYLGSGFSLGFKVFRKGVQSGVHTSAVPVCNCGVGPRRLNGVMGEQSGKCSICGFWVFSKQLPFLIPLHSVPKSLRPSGR